MGCGGSKTGPDDAVASGDQQTKNKALELELMKRREAEESITKVLLLGAGECGKSTILKQMKLLHLSGFSDEEKEQYFILCRRNLFDSIFSIARFAKEVGLQWSTPARAAEAAKVLSMDPTHAADFGDVPGFIEMMDGLWADPCSDQARKRQNEFYLLDSAKYFLSHTTRIFSAGFEPTTEDMLRARMTTTGIVETDFEMEGTHFKMYDVGGQRGERKKWIHTFDDVTSIMFIASLSEYDQVLAEDRTKNRLEESLELFAGIVNMHWFVDAAIILFLNKKDLFEEKIKTVDIGDYFPSYTDGCKYEPALEWIKGAYLSCNDDDDKMLYTHVTDATNTENVAFVWKATQHIILEKALAGGGFM